MARGAFIESVEPNHFTIGIGPVNMVVRGNELGGVSMIVIRSAGVAITTIWLTTINCAMPKTRAPESQAHKELDDQDDHAAQDRFGNRRGVLPIADQVGAAKVPCRPVRSRGTGRFPY